MELQTALEMAPAFWRKIQKLPGKGMTHLLLQPPPEIGRPTLTDEPRKSLFCCKKGLLHGGQPKYWFVALLPVVKIISQGLEKRAALGTKKAVKIHEAQKIL